jgi:hypothetical protein
VRINGYIMEQWPDFFIFFINKVFTKSNGYAMHRP